MSSVTNKKILAFEMNCFCRFWASHTEAKCETMIQERQKKTHQKCTWCLVQSNAAATIRTNSSWFKAPYKKQINLDACVKANPGRRKPTRLKLFNFASKREKSFLSTFNNIAQNTTRL